MSLRTTLPFVFIELFLVTLFLSGLFFLGSSIDKSWQMLSLGFLLYLYWHIYFIVYLLDWLKLKQFEKLPKTVGVWHVIFTQIATLQQNSLSKQKKLSSILSNYRIFVDALPDAAIIIKPQLDSSYHIEWFNKKAGNYLGLKKKTHLGKKILDVIKYEDLNLILSSNRYPNSAPNSYPNRKISEIEMPSPLGDNKIFSLRLLPYTYELKILLVRDISQTYRINKVRKDFVANVSHELRTPLTVVTGYLETLEGHFQGEKLILRPIQSMIQQSDRMAHLVEDLLTLSKLEADTRVNKALIDVPAMIGVLVKEAQLLNQKKRHSIAVNIDHSLMIQANEKELQSAFSNLISNAIQYTPAGGNIKISWYKKNKLSFFAVKDNGEGIATKHCQRLTERFYRVDKGRSRNNGGTGLGLAIVKHILKHHNAILDISSKVGKGSTFTCRFS